MIPLLLFEELTLLEPHRMELTRALAAADSAGLTFVDLRKLSGLTDGNLNRHLHRLETDGVVRTTREKVPGHHPRTLVQLTVDGRRRLRALGDALRATAAELEAAQSGMRVVRVTRTVAVEPNDATLIAPTPAMEAVQPAGSLVDEAFVGPD